MKRILLFTTALLMVLLNSCASLNTVEKAPATSMIPEVRLNVGVDDLYYLGETTVTAVSRSYFGCIHRVDKVNGVAFDRHRNTAAKLFGNNSLNIPGDLKYAVDKVLVEYPNADFYAPVLYKEEVNNMFLGKITTQTMVIKAYKYKVKQ